MKKITIGTLACSLMASGAIMGLMAYRAMYKDAKRSKEFWIGEYKKEVEQRVDWQHLAKDWIWTDKTMNDRLEEYHEIENQWQPAKD